MRPLNRRVEGADTGAARFQISHDLDCKRITNVVRSGFECQAPDSDREPIESADFFFKGVDNPARLRFVDAQGRCQQLPARIVLTSNVVHRTDVFIETRAAVTDPRLQEKLPDSRVVADPG